MGKIYQEIEIITDLGEDGIQRIAIAKIQIAGLVSPVKGPQSLCDSTQTLIVSISKNGKKIRLYHVMSHSESKLAGASQNEGTTPRKM
jgi:hypothetical protein